MLTNTSFQTSPVGAYGLPVNLLAVLSKIRQDWESVTDGKSLLNCEGSVGLLLFDIVTELNIPVEEQRHILGSVLFNEVTEFVTGQN